MRNYCKAYKGLGDLFNADSKVKTLVQRAIDVDLCACNLSSSTVNDPDGTVLYNNFANEFYSNYPGFSGLEFLNKCLLPQCAQSKFKSLPIPIGGCQVPQCINIINFENDGTFNNSTVNIDESAACVNITGKNVPVNPNNSDMLYIVLFIVIIIIIICFCNLS